MEFHDPSFPFGTVKKTFVSSYFWVSPIYELKCLDYNQNHPRDRGPLEVVYAFFRLFISTQRVVKNLRDSSVLTSLHQLKSILSEFVEEMKHGSKDFVKWLKLKTSISSIVVA